jgi:hypothetical protein
VEPETGEADPCCSAVGRTIEDSNTPKFRSMIRVWADLDQAVAGVWPPGSTASPGGWAEMLAGELMLS